MTPVTHVSDKGSIDVGSAREVDALVRDRRREPGSGKQWLAPRAVGAGLLFATGAVHLDLYLTGYRTIPTIGWLFLLQLITAFGLGAAVLVSSNRLVAATGGGFAIATLGGYLLSLRISLFGFREVRTAAGISAGVIEVATFAALAAFVLRPEQQRQPDRLATNGNLSDRLLKAIPAGRLAATAFTALVSVLLGLSLAATGPASTTATSSRALLHTTKIHGVSVLTNSSGYTLYWFAPDSPTRSTCYGTCAVYWPPVVGSPVAGLGVTGKLGAIMRTGGASQVSYDGHPLYTYVGDSAPGQATGNDINLNGGYWYEMAASGRVP
jgi:predicted lipoprotein with Yx(FWY)xxD motif